MTDYERTTELETIAKRGGLIRTRGHECANKHFWIADVKQGATPKLSGEVTQYCPYCQGKAISSTPWSYRAPSSESVLVEVYRPTDDNGEIGFKRVDERGDVHDIRASVCYESWQQWGADEQILGDNCDAVEAWRRGRMPGFVPEVED